MDEALAQLSESVQQELQSKMQPLMQQFLAESLELCRQVCKRQFQDFQQQQQQSRLRDVADPVVTAVTQGTGPTREEAARQAAKLLVSAALLSTATGASAHMPSAGESAASVPKKAAPVSTAPQPKATIAVAKAPLMKAKQAAPAPKPKAHDSRKSITEQVMGSMTRGRVLTFSAFFFSCHGLPHCLTPTKTC